MVDRLAQWDVTFYCTDHWPVYAAVFPSELDFCPFWQIKDCQKSLACLMTTTALYAAGARAYRIVSCKDCESFENSWEAVRV
jgi:hypothetical protein